MNEYIRSREVRSLNIQIDASYFYLLTIIVSIILLENSKKTIEDNSPFIDINDKLNIVLVNRIVSFLVVMAFLYTSFENIEVAKLKGQDLKSYYLELGSSILSLVGSIIVILVAIRAFDDNSFSLANLENPEV